MGILDLKDTPNLSAADRSPRCLCLASYSVLSLFGSNRPVHDATSMAVIFLNQDSAHLNILWLIISIDTDECQHFRHSYLLSVAKTHLYQRFSDIVNSIEPYL